MPFNNGLPEIAANCSTPESRVVLVDQFSGFDGVADTQADGIHPNAGGMKKIAARWYAALTPLLSVSGTDRHGPAGHPANPDAPVIPCRAGRGRPATPTATGGTRT